MPIESTPANPLPQNYAPSGGVPYKVQSGDDWGSVARRAGVDVWALIEFNFKTRKPDEINWYLRRNVGCKKATQDQKNWMFSSDASPGIVYLPSPHAIQAPSQPAAVAIQSVKFWMNAFIPLHVPGYTMTVPGGPHRGKTMIPGPQTVRVPTIHISPFHPVPTFGSTRVGVSDCYLTDQRGFSNDVGAKSRMHSEFRIDFSGPTPTMRQWHNCDYTTELDCEDGEQECHAQGSVSRMNFKLRAGAGNLVQVDMDCKASNPCAPTSRLFGDIDFNGAITIDRTARRLEFDGKVDQFPAFEAYAAINDGEGITLFQESPPPGNTVMNLPGGADRAIRRQLEDRDGDGRFETLTKL